MVTPCVSPDVLSPNYLMRLRSDVSPSVTLQHAVHDIFGYGIFSDCQLPFLIFPTFISNSVQFAYQCFYQVFIWIYLYLSLYLYIDREIDIDIEIEIEIDISR